MTQMNPEKRDEYIQTAIIILVLAALGFGLVMKLM